VVLFGKTTAGKSSIIQALIGGTGDTASPLGNPDHTLKVKRWRWGVLRLVDAPGFGGLNTSEALCEQLEKVRRAAASADVVVLCFDDENQRAAEFATVAS
jgi:predicted GTPase